jgi:hypothetical protein
MNTGMPDSFLLLLSAGTVMLKFERCEFGVCCEWKVRVFPKP